MRLALLIKDTEYRKALAGHISDYDRDILIDVISGADPIEPDALIVTDAKPADLEVHLLNSICKRTVFLTTGDPQSHSHHPQYSVSKYLGISRLLAELSYAYSAWQGIETHKSASSRIIAVCTDSDAFSGSRCTSLAMQIIYTHGGSVLKLPLSYINEDSVDYGRDINSFARLMYMVKSGREIDAAGISYSDSYGISHLMLPRGRNPLAYLENDDLDKLVFTMSRLFDVVILDIASCYREENLNIIKYADSLLCFESGRRRVDFSNLIKKTDIGQIKIIKLSEGSDEAYAIDDYIKEIYGSEYGTQTD